ncbi:MAG: tRNA 2-thiouridine(34) synthase MnmA [Deferribacterota bacterium]|nr:tRNA 2-thiouridine(34) synthase MnmA [Deferribacterota bacterium]
MKKVLAALSGGVDSSFAAYLKIQEGYEVIGVTLDLFGNKNFEDVEKVANFLGIDWYIANYQRLFSSTVISYFIKSYIEGLTPNPCAFCNRYAKFPFLINEMKKLKAHKIITGHYANICEFNNNKYIDQPLDTKKDQTYYLALLDRTILDNIEFPLSNYCKSEVRKIASKINLPSAKRRDSQEVCFLEGINYKDFLKNKLNKNKIKKGNFILNGEVIGSHKGLCYYTIGQRKHLDIGYHKPLYVAKKDTKSGDIILKEDGPFYAKGIKIKECSFIDSSTNLQKVYVMIRYRSKKAQATIEKLPNKRAVILFDEPLDSPAKGQLAAIYNDNKVLGGGFIYEVF